MLNNVLSVANKINETFKVMATGVDMAGTAFQAFIENPLNPSIRRDGTNGDGGTKAVRAAINAGKVDRSKPNVSGAAFDPFAEMDSQPIKRPKRSKRPEMEGEMIDFGLDESYREGGSVTEKKSGRMNFSGAMEKGGESAYSAIVAAMGVSGDTKQLMDANKTLKEIHKSIKAKGVSQGEVPVFVESIA